jgi:biopolymer transport protein ExbD
MAIKTRNKIGVNFNTSSMSDLVFLLLIFFMLTSTLIAPNAIKLLLPSSNNKTTATQDVTVSIDEWHQYYVDDEETPVDLEQLRAIISGKIDGLDEATVVVRSHKEAPVQDLVHVIDIVNDINKDTHTKHKVILATSPESKKQ